MLRKQRKIKHIPTLFLLFVVLLPRKWGKKINISQKFYSFTSSLPYISSTTKWTQNLKNPNRGFSFPWNSHMHKNIIKNPNLEIVIFSPSREENFYSFSCIFLYIKWKQFCWVVKISIQKQQLEMAICHSGLRKLFILLIFPAFSQQPSGPKTSESPTRVSHPCETKKETHMQRDSPDFRTSKQNNFIELLKVPSKITSRK